MKSINPFLISILVLNLLQAGCSAQTTANNTSKTENHNQIATTQPATQKPGNHYILAGMTPGEAEGLAKALEQAEISSGPILKASKFEREKKWDEAIQAYQNAMTFDRHKGGARLGLARIYEKLGDYKQAAEQLEHALPLINDWAKPEYEKKLSELKAKAAQQNRQPAT